MEVDLVHPADEKKEWGEVRQRVHNRGASEGPTVVGVDLLYGLARAGVLVANLSAVSEGARRMQCAFTMWASSSVAR